MSTWKNEDMLVHQVMLTTEKFPVIKSTALFKDAIDSMNNFKLGISCIIDNNNELLGVITDGDIRRNIVKIQKPFSALLVDDAIQHAIKKPVSINKDQTLISAIDIMEEKQIWDLPVIEDNKLIGLLHLHPAIKALLK